MGELAGSPEPWTESFERHSESLVRAILTGPTGARDQAWRELMTRLAPHIERWASESFVLRRCGLREDDDARAVLVNALGKLQSNDFANLRRYLERREPGAENDRAETQTLRCIVRLASTDHPGLEDPPARDQTTGTPMRAWMLTLVSYTIKDHVRQRLGRAGPGTSGGSAISSKRDVNTNAGRLDACIEQGSRPAMTDFLTMQRFVAEVMQFIETFPPKMREAATLWLQEASLEEISEKTGSASVEEVRALVRAAKARLRERFRGEWDQHLGLVSG